MVEALCQRKFKSPEKIYKTTLGFEFYFLLTIKATKGFLQLRDAIGTYYIHLEEGAGNTVLISFLEK